ncbi:uncharacterized protein AB675_527 [Cyphellophora attinorum]|uniref:DUF3074 domain-containing protein n=1 Tax=Cyphellophora attinorum TaxID=1664694 RepID=A0A0N1I1J6_9EURO|nr:uncharacterized protein AB675_527 [Phialophora attinorum]KPI45760.1 hypothetical protein AB675_527 [Phialophora attinorum]
MATTWNYPPGLSPLLRLTPLNVSDLPPHPDLAKSLPKVKDGEQSTQPDLLPFVTTLLNDGLAFLSKSEIANHFKHTTTKKADGSDADVDVLLQSISKSTIGSRVTWHNTNDAANRPSSRRASATPSVSGKGKDTTTAPSTSDQNHLAIPTNTQQPNSRSASVSSTTAPTSRSRIQRPKPTSIADEHWYTRRSIHTSHSSKLSPGSAPEEFLFGLLNEHSKNEQAFTPNLFDAHPILNWDGQIRKLAEEGGLRREGWMDVSASVWEMCHDLPGILGPRCFGVCVVGGRVVPEQGMAGPAAEGGGTSNDVSTRPGTVSGLRRWERGEKQKFVVVTVPVVLEKVKASFYASYRNMKEGKDEKQKRPVVQGLYAAVETCTLRAKTSAATATSDGAAAVAEEEEEVEWIMSTASDAKGNLPMWMQKLALPGQLPKDVSYFMKWIRGVDEEDVEKALAKFE